MPRKARVKSESGIYHIMMRGINRQCIFEEEEDYEKFIETIKRYKEISGYEIYAYCLMSNHVHLLLKVGEEPLDQIMRRICGSYVYWYNWKYQRVGNLFQDRFKSEVVEDDAYLLIVQRYIHQNPIKAGLVKKVEHYKWNSINEYINKAKVVDSNLVLSMFNNNPNEAKRAFIDYNNETEDCVCLDIEERIRLTDEEAREIIKRVAKVNHAGDLQNMDIKSRNIYLRELKEQHGLSVRQIERISGVNRGVIFKA
ncbi:MAG: transposase [Syntrophomonadaceae bacterium]|nr:transposase [Syntrophomonadaceae bacterium]